MRIALVATALIALASAAQAATTPGTIISTAAVADYKDSSGQQMPQQTSNTESVLVISANPARTVMLPVRALYHGPSTVGRTIKVLGTITSDGANFWIDDGSMLPCKVCATFLSKSPPEGLVCVTGISQVDADGVAAIIPSTDSEVESVAQ